MNLLDRIRKDPQQFVADLEKYFIDTPAECPYGLPFMAIYRQARFDNMPEPVMSLLLHAGFRRNGNCLYIMRCRGCSACVPIRLAVDSFKPNRNQRRTTKKNLDLIIETGPLAVTDEKLSLMEAFLACRYPGRETTAVEYYQSFFYNSFGRSFEFRYRLDDRLVGVAIVDQGSTWLNAVYFFFDPALHRRSLGTFNILSLVDECRLRGLDLLYLGYFIENVRAMKYKAAFRPHYLLRAGEWTRVA